MVNDQELRVYLIVLAGAWTIFALNLVYSAGCEWGDATKSERPLPERFVRLGEISKELGVTVRWEAE